MKKLLSVLLAVAMMVTAMSALSFSASAAEDDVCLYSGLLKDADGNDVTSGENENNAKWSYADGVLTIESTSDAGASFDIWSPVAEFDVATQKGIVFNYVADVPVFMCVQVTTKAGEKWPSTGSDFYNTFGYAAGDLTDATVNNEAQKFMPAGSKSGIINLNGFFTWDAANGNDQTPDGGKSKISLVNLKLAGKGKIEIYALHLTTDAPTEGADVKEGGKNGYLSGVAATDPTTAGDNKTTAAGGNTATTTAANGSSAKTGEESNALLFVVVAAVAVAVVGVSAVAAKKAKSK